MMHGPICIRSSDIPILIQNSVVTSSLSTINSFCFPKTAEIFSFSLSICVSPLKCITPYSPFFRPCAEDWSGLEIILHRRCNKTFALILRAFRIWHPSSRRRASWNNSVTRSITLLHCLVSCCCSFWWAVVLYCWDPCCFHSSRSAFHYSSCSILTSTRNFFPCAPHYSHNRYRLILYSHHHYEIKDMKMQTD